jgi:hypothetical protein
MTGKWVEMSQRKTGMSRLSFEALLAAGHCPFYNLVLCLRSSNRLCRVPAYMRQFANWILLLVLFPYLRISFVSISPVCIYPSFY